MEELSPERFSPPQPSAARAPVPGWMWGWFTLVPVGSGALGGVVGWLEGWEALLTAPLTGALTGLLVAVPFLAGLALAGRCFRGTVGRMVGGVIFGALLLAIVVAALVLILARLFSGLRWQS